MAPIAPLCNIQFLYSHKGPICCILHHIWSSLEEKDQRHRKWQECSPFLLLATSLTKLWFDSHLMGLLSLSHGRDEMRRSVGGNWVCEGLRVALCFLLPSSTIFTTFQELWNLQSISLQLFGQVLWLLLFRRFDGKMNMCFSHWDIVFFRHLLK